MIIIAAAVRQLIEDRSSGALIGRVWVTDAAGTRPACRRRCVSAAGCCRHCSRRINVHQPRSHWWVPPLCRSPALLACRHTNPLPLQQCFDSTSCCLLRLRPGHVLRPPPRQHAMHVNFTHTHIPRSVCDGGSMTALASTAELTACVPFGCVARRGGHHYGHCCGGTRTCRCCSVWCGASADRAARLGGPVSLSAQRSLTALAGVCPVVVSSRPARDARGQARPRRAVRPRNEAVLGGRDGWRRSGPVSAAQQSRSGDVDGRGRDLPQRRRDVAEVGWHW